MNASASDVCAGGYVPRISIQPGEERRVEMM